MSNFRHVLTILVLMYFCLTLLGCPDTRDLSVAIKVSPEELDFGLDKDVMTFSVNKLLTTRNMSPFIVYLDDDDEDWIIIDECLSLEDGCMSEGPQDEVTITVRIDRTKMEAGHNTGVVTVKASGIEMQTVDIHADAAVVPRFTVDTRIPYEEDAVTFIDDSKTLSSKWEISRWDWDFDNDGITDSTERYPAAYSYDGAGTYSVSLTVEAKDNQGHTMTVSALSKDYMIVAERVGPQSLFSAAITSPIAGNSNIHFTDESVAGTSEIMSWEWDFGDGAISYEPGPMHVYDIPGVYNVSLTVTSNHGTDTFTEYGYISVSAESPSAAFSVSTNNVLANVPVIFTDDSIAGSAPIDTWLWDFGDDTTSTEQNPSHSYSDGGTYSVTLRVETAHAKDTTETPVEIIVSAVPPQAGFVADIREAVIGKPVTFTDISDPGTSPIISWAWSFGDDETSTLQDPTHIYEEAGTYTVSLFIETAHGTSSEEIPDYVSVIVSGVPTAAFRVDLPDVLYENEPVQFIDESIEGLASAPITNWSWDFGDDTTSILENPVHTYTGYGLYTVSLTVKSSEGSDTVTRPELVEVIQTVEPVARFSASPRSGDANLEVEFTDLSIKGTADITEWHWDFGDGNTSTEQNPTHLYTRPSDKPETPIEETYTVILAVATRHGFNSMTDEITVTGSSEPDLAVSPDTIELSVEENEAGVTVSNAGADLLNWRAESNDPGITVDPIAGVTYLTSDVVIGLALDSLTSTENLYVTFTNSLFPEDQEVVSIVINN